MSTNINWDIVTEQAKRKSQEFAKTHANQTLEAAFYAGYMENAAERESLRVIKERLESKPISGPEFGHIVRTKNIAPELPSLGSKYL